MVVFHACKTSLPLRADLPKGRKRILKYEGVATNRVQT
jgi:hypothetical protein